MKKRYQIAALVLLCFLVLAGCGKKDDKVRYAVIAGTAGISGQPELSAITAGVEAYAGENGYISKIYTATEDSEEGYKAQIDAAAEDGARYVIVWGKDFETAVYDGQDDHHKLRFLYFDGAPRKSPDAEETLIRKNTECFSFGKSDIGFLAGYAAVRDGSRNIAFLSDEDSGDTASYYEGFRRGIAYAENELMLTSSDLSLYAEFCGSDALSPRRLGDGLDFYNSGIELIVTDKEGLAEACDRAAAAAGKGSIVSLGVDLTAVYSHVKFAAVADRESAVRSLLSSIESEDAFAGGTEQELSAAQYAAMISADFSRFVAFGQDSYRSILNALAQMSQEASSADAEGEEGGASVYGAADAESVSVTEVSSGSITGSIIPSGSAQTIDAVSVDGSAEEGTEADSELSDADSGETSGDEAGEDGSEDWESEED